MATQIHGAGPAGQRSPGLDLAIAGYLTENPPAGGGDTTAQVGTFTLPESPTEGQTVTILADEETVIPGGITWDSGGEPTVTGRLLIACVWSGDDWVCTYGLPFAAAPEPDDETPPTAGTLGIVVGSTTADGTVTGAEDETAINAAPYSFRVDGGTWSAWQAGATYEWTGLTASTEYDFQHRVRDAAGNITEGSVVTDTTDAPPSDTTPPTPGTLASSAITSSGFTLTVSGASDAGSGLHATPYAFSTDNGSNWSAYQAGASFNASGLDPETEYTCVHRVRDAAANVATGASITVETTAAGAAVTFYTDFSEYTTGAAPSDWTSLWAAFNTLQVQDDAGATNGKVLRMTATSQARRAVIWDDVPYAESVEILIRFKWVSAPTMGGSHGMHIMRAYASGAASSENSVAPSVLGASDDSLSCSQTYYLNGAAIGAVESSSTGLTLVAGDWYWMRGQVDRATQTVRSSLWKDGSAEPGSWTRSHTWPTAFPESGGFGVGAFAIADVAIDIYSIGLDGAAAP